MTEDEITEVKHQGSENVPEYDEEQVDGFEGASGNSTGNESSDFESAEEESSGEEGSDAEDKEEDEDDGYALLALTKQRLAAAATAAEKQKEQEEDSDEEEDDFESPGEEENEDEQGKNDEGSLSPESVDENEATETKKTLVPRTVPDNTSSPGGSANEEKKQEEEEDKSQQSPSTETSQSSPNRKRRDENAELWALLQESKSRIADVEDIGEVDLEIVEDIEKKDDDMDDTTVDVSVNATIAENGDSSPVGKDALEVGDEKEEDEETKKRRDLWRENQELQALLKMSKKRLLDAEEGLKKKEEAKNNKSEQKPKEKMENPYKEIENLPDEVPAEDDDELTLTQKELLIAMAVAEEAARSGKEEFQTETVPRDELRNRDLTSFTFLKEEDEKKKEQAAVQTIAPSSPSEAGKVLETTTANSNVNDRLSAMSLSLRDKIKNIKRRINQIDEMQAQR